MAHCKLRTMMATTAVDRRLDEVFFIPLRSSGVDASGSTRYQSIRRQFTGCRRRCCRCFCCCSVQSSFCNGASGTPPIWGLEHILCCDTIIVYTLWVVGTVAVHRRRRRLPSRITYDHRKTKCEDEEKSRKEPIDGVLKEKKQAVDCT